MASNQRYVSDELTHFVGRRSFIQGETRKATNKERYKQLLKYLRSGLITFFPHNGKEPVLKWYFDRKISTNKQFPFEGISFCDIPLSDLKIHMKKYSKFGVAFLKSNLVKKGATPIFYIANNSLTKSGKRRIDLLDEKFDKDKITYLKAYSEFSNDTGKTNKEKELFYAKIQHFLFLHEHIYPFFKLFDDSKSEADENNYYMEREWRVVGNLHFKLNEVQRIIIPKSYAKQIRKDLPEYIGQISFSD